MEILYKGDKKKSKSLIENFLSSTANILINKNPYFFSAKTYCLILVLETVQILKFI